MRILVVEDSPIVADRLLELLREVRGLEIMGSARSVEETLTLVARLNPDVIVLDLQIPGGTGLEVLRSMKTAPRHPVVIVLTNSASEPFRQACLEAGAEYFLDKSNEFDRLPAVLALVSGEPPPAFPLGAPPAVPAAEVRPELPLSTLPRRRTGSR